MLPPRVGLGATVTVLFLVPVLFFAPVQFFVPLQFFVPREKLYREEKGATVLPHSKLGAPCNDMCVLEVRRITVMLPPRYGLGAAETVQFFVPVQFFAPVQFFVPRGKLFREE